jgi:membrane protease YdiL (CAAX protease family)
MNEMEEKTSSKKQLTHLAELLVEFIGFLIIWMLLGGIATAAALFLFFDLDFLDPIPRKLDPYKLLVSQALSLLAALVTLAIFETKTSTLLRDVVKKIRDTRISEFLFGAFTSLLIIGGSFLLILFSGAIELRWISGRPILTSVPIFFLIGITEEVIFRGFLLRSLLKRVSVIPSILISSLLFAAIHAINPHFNLIGFLAIFISGIVLGILYFKTNNLSAPIGAHFIWNLLQNLLGFPVSGQALSGVFSVTYLSDRPWLTGGAFGLEGSVVTILCTLLLMAGLWRISGKL